MVNVIKRLSPADPLHMVLIAVALLSLIRLVMLFTLPFNLYPDEAQYWTWSLEPAFGYFSKPPLIAWLIALTTSLCGDGEACVRLSSPLIHSATAGLLYVLGRRLYDTSTGVMAALLYATLPAVTFSSLIISTDVPLLFFWALGVLSLWNFLQGRQWQWALLFGVALGFGALSKYAMLYIVLCAGLFILATPDARWILRDKKFALSLLVAFFILLPNLIWNAMNAGVTFLHTASNANLQNDFFHPENLFSFLGSQFGVLGPILAGILCWGLARRWYKGASSDRFLLIFSLPLLAMMAVLALLSRANANWAAAAYIGLVPVVASWLYRYGRKFWRETTLASHVVIMVVFTILLYLPARLFPFSLPYPFHRVVGWEQTAAQVEKRLLHGRHSAILTSDRDVFAQLSYYLPSPHPPLAMWKEGEVGNHYELKAPLTDQAASRPLLVSLKKRNDDVLRGFSNSEYVGSTRIPLGPKRSRIVRFYELSDFRVGGN